MGSGWTLGIRRLARVGCSAPNERCEPRPKRTAVTYARSGPTVWFVNLCHCRVCTIPGIIFRNRTNYRGRRSDLHPYPFSTYVSPPSICLPRNFVLLFESAMRSLQTVELGVLFLSLPGNRDMHAPSSSISPPCFLSLAAAPPSYRSEGPSLPAKEHT